MTKKGRRWRLALILWFFSLMMFFSQVEAKMIQIALRWDPPEVATNVTGYMVYWGPWMSSVQNLTTSYKKDAGNRLGTCLSIDDIFPVYFFVVTAYNASGSQSSPSNMVYHLFGNIVGDSSSGTPPANARVDGADQAMIGIYFGRSVTHQVINCDAGNFVENTDLQKTDLKKDNRIDGLDLIEMGIRFGNTAAQ